MSYANPQPAIENLCGRSYTFRGATVRNTNAAMLAVARTGVPLDKLSGKMLETFPVAAWAMLNDVDAVAEMLGKPEEIYPFAAKFCSQFSPEELGELFAIYSDCIRRFVNSFTSYSPADDASLGKEGNEEARAVIS